MSDTLNVNNIQGDIILGLQKKVQEFVFFQITDVTLFRQAMKAIVPFITTTAQVQQQAAQIAQHKASGASGLLPLPCTNLAFSNSGLTKMGLDTTQLISATSGNNFINGQQSDAVSTLQDPTTTSSGKVVPDWDAEFLEQIDGVFLLASDSTLTLTTLRASLEAIWLTSIKVIVTLDAAVRPGTEAGHEHFGFKDGISNPAIDGFAAAGTYPGQLPVQPGVIVLGHTFDNNGTPDTRTSQLAKDGSFLVFRKLKQLVPEFNAFLLKNGTGFDGLTPQQGADFLGARLVGRWKSGAPIDLAPIQDNPTIGADPEQNNNFLYNFTNPDDFSDQTRCPFSAHLRKTNPRNDLLQLLDGAPDTFLAPHRIIRQGIPYGPEVTAAESASGVTANDRGLAFVSYQSSISNGFAFVQQSWANNTGFPPKAATSNIGFDPIIGQAAGADRALTGFDPKNQSASLDLGIQQFVVPRGGEYFFSPSIDALTNVIAKNIL